MASDEVETEENKKNPRCFLDISIDGKPGEFSWLEVS